MIRTKVAFAVPPEFAFIMRSHGGKEIVSGLRPSTRSSAAAPLTAGQAGWAYLPRRSSHSHLPACFGLLAGYGFAVDREAFCLPLRGQFPLDQNLSLSQSDPFPALSGCFSNPALSLHPADKVLFPFIAFISICYFAV